MVVSPRDIDADPILRDDYLFWPLTRLLHNFCLHNRAKKKMLPSLYTSA